MGFIEWLKSIFAAKPKTPSPSPSAATTPTPQKESPAATPAMPAPSEVRFQEISRILIYRQGSEERLANQWEYLKTMADSGLTKDLVFYWLERVDPAADEVSLLLETGSASAFTRPLHLAVKEEILLRALPGKKWEDLWADEVLLDLPDLAENASHCQTLKQLKEEISKRLYKIKDVIGL